MKVPLLETAEQTQASIFHEVDLDAGMTPLVVAQKHGQRVFDHHRCCADAQNSRFAAVQGACPRVERIGFHEKAAALPQQILALRGQAKTPTDAIEQPNLELGFERQNLPRRRRLADRQARTRAGDAAGFGDADECLHMAQVHGSTSVVFCMKNVTINALYTSSPVDYLFRWPVPTALRSSASAAVQSGCGFVSRPKGGFAVNRIVTFGTLLGTFATFALSSEGSAQQPIRIGASASLKGNYSLQGGYLREGYLLCQKEVNAKGGVLGRPVEFVIYDDGSDEKTAVRLYEKLVSEDKVDALLGPYSSPITDAVAEANRS